MARFSCASACSLAGLSLLHSRVAFKREEALGFRGQGVEGLGLRDLGLRGFWGWGLGLSV